MQYANCPYVRKCWRHSYSQYLIDIGYNMPPERIVLFQAGYATIGMMPKKGIYAENMPMVTTCQINICPAIECGDASSCAEYIKEAKREANLQRGRQRHNQYPNARPRLYLPKELRQAVAKRDHYKCVYCGRAHNQIWGGKRITCVVDHIIPLALGGHETDESNLAFACRDCNRDKSVSIWERGSRIGYYDEI